MLLNIQGYNFTVEYRPGEQMILTDTLSRLPNPINNDDVDLDVRVDGLVLEADDPQHLTISLINFPTAKQQLLKDETLRDPILNGLREVIYRGWPEKIYLHTTERTVLFAMSYPWKQILPDPGTTIYAERHSQSVTLWPPGCRKDATTCT